MKILNNEILFFDGAMGTMLQSHGLQLRELPETLNITNPDLIKTIHKEYLNAGANFITSNTFGANKFKLAKSGFSVQEIIEAGTFLTHEITSEFNSHENSRKVFSVLDIGATGKVMAPVGDASFQEIYDCVAEQVTAGKKFSDVILLETFTDLYELKAAVLAALENSELPVFATMSFEQSGRTFFGASVESMIATLQDLGISAIGVNCSLGPEQLLPIVKKFCEFSHVPVMVQPNAGLPVIREGKTFYDVTPEKFAEISVEFAKMGVAILGGCCGTTPEHILKMRNAVLKNSPKIASRKVEDNTIISSGSNVATFGKKFVVIGERLNPTGKKTLQKAIREKDFDFMIKEALKQQEQNAKVLDLNVGLPDINEPEFLKESLLEIQSVINLPIQIDSANFEALESAARIYNGKPILNSVNGKTESLEKVLPIAKKYGACVLGLTLDENGIPETANERFKIAEKIVKSCEKIGIPRRNILIDCLTLTASAQQKLVIETLKAIKLIKSELKVCTVLGLSNVSFGLPRRSLLNRTMLTASLMQGLDAAIINPGDTEIRETLMAWNLLTGNDDDIQNYISYCEENPVNNNQVTNVISKENFESENKESNDIISAIKKGLKEESAKLTQELLKNHEPLEIIEKYIVPALDLVGKDYESGKLFLPQLIKSAEAAKSAFENLSFSPQSDNTGFKIKVALATVYGDVHDIGKNIVKTIFENYNFEVMDLGKDVPPEKIIQAVQENKIQIVGLSALMTTTVASMKDTIEKLRVSCPNVKIIVGGAVLTPELAKFAGADYYARDAMEGVRIVSSLA